MANLGNDIIIGNNTAVGGNTFIGNGWTAVGHNVGKKELTEIVAFGFGADATEEKSMAIGYHCKANHERATVIGVFCESKHNNSVLIMNNEFLNNSLSVGNEAVLILGDNEDQTHVCSVCDTVLVNGVKWKQEEEYSHLGLCFDCILETAMAFKAKENFIKNSGIDPMKQMQSDIKILQEQVATLQNNKQPRY